MTIQATDTKLEGREGSLDMCVCAHHLSGGTGSLRVSAFNYSGEASGVTAGHGGTWLARQMHSPPHPEPVLEAEHIHTYPEGRSPTQRCHAGDETLKTEGSFRHSLASAHLERSELIVN
jgi:hypothetical protein